jgi:hypothetical protein
MKVYALLMVLLLAISGCTTSYKGSVKGASNQDGSKSSNSIVAHSDETPAKR